MGGPWLRPGQLSVINIQWGVCIVEIDSLTISLAQPDSWNFVRGTCWPSDIT